MNRLLQLGGGVVVVVVLADIFFTVLFPASGRGPLRRPLSAGFWMLMRLLARVAPRGHRRDVLSYSGPLLILLTISAWGILLVVGWAMIYLPALGSGIRSTSGTPATGWWTAVYVSAYALSTLGVGDVAPAGSLYRVLTVVEAGVGFAALSMTVTYFLSVYNAITERKTTAASLHHRTFGTGDPVDLIAAVAHGDDADAVVEQLAEKGEFVQRLFETHRSYPVLRYFHFREIRYALPRVLLIALDAAAFATTALHSERHRRVAAGPETALISGAAHDLLRELVPRAYARKRSVAPEANWRERYRSGVRRLQDAGFTVRRDLDAGATEYVRLRRTWDEPLRSLAAALLYDWDEIEIENNRTREDAHVVVDGSDG